MLHPNQFEVNEAWILFRLNGAPVRTECDGDFNCFALMDAASCFILGSAMIPSCAAEPTSAQLRAMLEDARHHKNQLPEALFVAREETADLITREATRQKIAVVQLPESELMLFIGEARQAFAEKFEKKGDDA